MRYDDDERFTRGESTGCWGCLVVMSSGTIMLIAIAIIVSLFGGL